MYQSSNQRKLARGKEGMANREGIETKASKNTS
jgi:hypothetical protein